jgi:5-bromo-4-chloroindolyl phosphate hydrolysis protein
MDDTIRYGVVIIILLAAIVYVAIKNSGRDRERENRERGIELVIYKKEMDRLEEKLRRKKISKDDYERLRKNLEEQHLKKMAQIRRL